MHSLDYMLVHSVQLYLSKNFMLHSNLIDFIMHPLPLLSNNMSFMLLLATHYLHPNMYYLVFNSYMMLYIMLLHILVLHITPHYYIHYHLVLSNLILVSYHLLDSLHSIMLAYLVHSYPLCMYNYLHYLHFTPHHMLLLSMSSSH